MASITIHAKQRIAERVNTNLGAKKLFRYARNNGLDIINFRGKFKQYLMSKSRGMKQGIKVYEDNLYIYTKNSKRLITVYPVPEKYLPLSRYESIIYKSKVS